MKFNDKQKKELINNISAVMGNNLTSILIYGSYVRGDFIKGKSDINILIVRKKRNNNELSKLHKIIKKWHFKINMDIPLILTENEIKTSTDVYPMEYSDIKDNNIVLYGKDIFKSLKINNKNLRLELENQVKSKLILLRRNYIIKKDKKSIKKILLLSLPTINIILKNILKLNKKAVDTDIIQTCKKITKIDLSIVNDTINIKQHKTSHSKKELEKLYDKLIITFEKLSDYVDKFKVKKG